MYSSGVGCATTCSRRDLHKKRRKLHYQEINAFQGYARNAAKFLYETKKSDQLTWLSLATLLLCCLSESHCRNSHPTVILHYFTSPTLQWFRNLAVPWHSKESMHQDSQRLAVAIVERNTYIFAEILPRESQCRAMSNNHIPATLFDEQMSVTDDIGGF